MKLRTYIFCALLLWFPFSFGWAYSWELFFLWLGLPFDWNSVGVNTFWFGLAVGSLFFILGGYLSYKKFLKS